MCGNGFIYIFIGSVLGGMGVPFFVNSPSKVSATWFPTSEVIKHIWIENSIDMIGLKKEL